MQSDKSLVTTELRHRLLPVERPGGGGGPKDEKLDIAWLINIFIRRRKILIASVLLALVMGAVYCMIKTRRYEAQGEIAVHAEGSGALNLEDASGGALGAMGGDWSSRLETQVRVLRSGTLAGIVISDLQLDQKPEFNPFLNKPKSVPEYIKQARVQENFAKDLTVQSVPRTQVIQIGFRNQDPVLATAIVNDLSRVYQEHSFMTRYEATQQASTWLSRQLGDLKGTVEQEQERLAAYQKQYGIIGTDENNNLVMTRLDELSRQLTEAEADRITREAKYRIALSGDPALVQSISTDPTLPALEQERASLQNQLAEAQTTYGSAYPRVVEIKAQLAQTQKSIERTMDQIRERYKNEFGAAQNEENSLRRSLDEQKQAAYRLSENFSQYNILKDDVESGRSLYEDLLSKLQEAGIAASLRSTNVEIIDAAVRPIKPVEPEIPFVMLFALFCGVVIGIGLVFLYDRIDQRVSSIEEVEWISRLPLFGVIPSMGSRGRMREPGPESASSLALMSVRRPQAQFSEAFRSLRTAILLGAAGAPPRIIVITGSISGEGKSTISANCAAVLSHSDQRILLIDADMRRGKLHEALGLGARVGLSECLAGASDWRTAVRSVPDAPHLDFLSRGARPPSPADLLSSRQMEHLIEEWSREYDHIVFDTPPALIVTDALLLCRFADVVITVARHRFSNRHALRRSSELILKSSRGVVGLVVNALDLTGTYYGYKYGYYGPADASNEAYYEEGTPAEHTKP
jgi:capsular exopolysaccharide synthesis family protein